MKTKTRQSVTPRMWIYVNSWPACQLHLPMKQKKQNIRGFSVSVYSKRFQKIKQSVHIPFRKIPTISSHGRLSNWNDASDDKSICVTVWETAWYLAHRFPSVLPKCTIWAILFVCVCVYWCIIQDFKLYTWMVSIYMYSTYTYKTNEQDFSYTAWHRKGWLAYNLSI